MKYCKIISINRLLTKFILSLTNSLIYDFFFHVEVQFLFIQKVKILLLVYFTIQDDLILCL